MNGFQTNESTFIPPKKPKKSANDVLMGRVATDMRYLKSTVDLNMEADIQKQLISSLYTTLREHGLGYCDGNQEGQLRVNAARIRDTLCFVQKHWRVLLRADFPKIPDDTEEGFHESILLTKLSGLKRLGNSCKR